MTDGRKGNASLLLVHKREGRKGRIVRGINKQSPKAEQRSSYLIVRAGGVSYRYPQLFFVAHINSTIEIR
jgi:hypothetical protein